MCRLRVSGAQLAYWGLCWLLRGSFDCSCCPRGPQAVHSLPRCVSVLHALSRPSTICPSPPHGWSAPDGLPLLLHKQPIWAAGDTPHLMPVEQGLPWHPVAPPPYGPEPTEQLRFHPDTPEKPGVGGRSTAGAGVDTALWLAPPPPPNNNNNNKALFHPPKKNKGSIDRTPKNPAETDPWAPEVTQTQNSAKKKNENGIFGISASRGFRKIIVCHVFFFGEKN